MPDRSTALEDARRSRLVAELITIRNVLDAAGEMLAAIHVTHAIELIEPRPSIDQTGVDQQG